MDSLPMAFSYSFVPAVRIAKAQGQNNTRDAAAPAAADAAAFSLLFLSCRLMATQSVMFFQWLA